MSTSLPEPSGDFAVGRAIADWRSDDDIDSLAPTPRTKRELLVWFWYPASPAPGSATAAYVPDELRTAASASAVLPLGGLMRLVTRDPSKVRTNSYQNAPISDKEHSYPVVILRGGASAGVVGYSTLAEDLASHGYGVVGFDAPYRTGVVVFPDGRIFHRTPDNNPELFFGRPDSVARIDRLLADWNRDIAFSLDRLKQLNTAESAGRWTGRLDLDRVGLVGHSLGGAAIMQFCHDDARCKAGVDIDGAPLGRVVQTGLDRPFMFLLGEHGDSANPETRAVNASIETIYDRLPVDTRARVALHGANHFLFADDAALLKSHLLMSALRLVRVVSLTGTRQLALTSHCLASFFDAELKRPTHDALVIVSPKYPEIVVLR